MGDMGEIFNAMKEDNRIKRQKRDEFYSKIMEELGARYLNNSTWRLGEYNVYTSKGYVLPKSNKGESIPLQVFLKDNYNINVARQDW